ncbi:hypothetical protein MKK75_25695 [Methylobacterium sp. J-030]|nr:hypothetical protein [Methylobacterium sp. J-030]MCJ2072152.1 hypothetical protein [Methylobacterium sp. J-030]
MAARWPAGRADPLAPVRDPESRFAPQALFCTDLDREPVQIVSWFVQR